MSILSITARASRGAAVLAAVAFLPLACSSDNAATTRGSDAVTITDQWVKAADGDMSAAFGRLANSGDTPVTVVSATSPASARIELHEVVAAADGTKKMRPKDGGFVVPAHGSLTLAPGADHIMFMGLNGPLRTGSETAITLTFGDGSSASFTARVRDFAGNQEQYEGGTAAPAPAHGA
ncbi:copper chaperone PCu(A)C [Nocardia arizonensis]|uniref:copper chaperone PCu(A)C n=1 Tax=Nocardia arizonensis TaxID=1141647 RepID=UPI0006D0EADD|nr:copper chaperone PCu(A)C [Nocardia arizonensis]